MTLVVNNAQSTVERVAPLEKQTLEKQRPRNGVVFGKTSACSDVRRSTLEMYRLYGERVKHF